MIGRREGLIFSPVSFLGEGVRATSLSLSLFPNLPSRPPILLPPHPRRRRRRHSRFPSGPASQAVPKENEGVTSLVLGDKAVSLVEALAVAEGPLFGSWMGGRDGKLGKREREREGWGSSNLLCVEMRIWGLRVIELSGDHKKGLFHGHRQASTY